MGTGTWATGRSRELRAARATKLPRGRLESAPAAYALRGSLSPRPRAGLKHFLCQVSGSGSRGPDRPATGGASAPPRLSDSDPMASCRWPWRRCCSWRPASRSPGLCYSGRSGPPAAADAGVQVRPWGGRGCGAQRSQRQWQRSGWMNGTGRHVRRSGGPRGSAVVGPGAGWAPGWAQAPPGDVERLASRGGCRASAWCWGALRKTAKRGPGDPGALGFGEVAVDEEPGLGKWRGSSSAGCPLARGPSAAWRLTAAVSFRITPRASRWPVLIRTLEPKVLWVVRDPGDPGGLGIGGKGLV